MVRSTFKIPRGCRPFFAQKTSRVLSKQSTTKPSDFAVLGGDDRIMLRDAPRTMKRVSPGTVRRRICVFTRDTLFDISSLFLLLSNLHSQPLHKYSTQALSGVSPWLNVGLAGNRIAKIRVTPKFIYACAERDGLYRLNKMNVGSPWQYLGFKEPPVTKQKDSPPPSTGILDVAISSENENTLLVGRGILVPGVAGIYKSTDGGTEWYASDNGFDTKTSWWNPFANDRYAQVLFVPREQKDTVFVGSAWRGDVFRSTNFGSTWQIVGPSAGIALFQEITSFAQDPTAPRTFWAGGYVDETSTWLLRSDDGGMTWSKVLTHPLTFFNNTVTGIAITASPHTTYVACNDALSGSFLLASPDDGLTWSKILDASAPSDLLRIEVDPYSDSHLIVGGGTSLFESHDAGTTWAQLPRGETNDTINCLAWDLESGGVLMGTSSSGVFLLPNASVRKFHVEPYALGQNYPNPFNPRTSISYKLFEESHVRLSIVNLLGEEIKMLVNDNQSVGDHRIQWDGTDNHGRRAPSGPYLYRLSVNGRAETKKMLYIH